MGDPGAVELLTILLVALIPAGIVVGAVVAFVRSGRR